MHGLSGSTRWWSRNIPALAERYSVYLLAEDVRGDLQRIEAPTLLVWGENDTLVPPAVGSVLREEIPDSRLLALTGAAHMRMFDRPVEFNAALMAFLAGDSVRD